MSDYGGGAGHWDGGGEDVGCGLEEVCGRGKTRLWVRSWFERLPYISISPNFIYKPTTQESTAYYSTN